MTDETGWEAVARSPPEEDLHRVAAVEEWPWLPSLESHTLAKHPYCEECGAVRVMGSASGLDRGGLVNLLAGLDRRLREDDRKITESQRRLIFRKLETDGVADGFAMPRRAQLQHVVEVVARYCGWDEAYIEDRLEASRTVAP